MTLGVEEDVSMIELEVRQADVTELKLDTITNAANTELRHGDLAEQAFRLAVEQ
jgi:hypothetical protein